jgi:ABC-type Zn uptake system ZnuABC Zn-binding protein ZnuA
MHFARVLPALACAVLAAGLAACGDNAASGSAQLRVVATTTQTADFVREVGGSRVAVTQLLSPNTDPHEYEVRPSDVKALATADVVVRSGGELDHWLGGAIDSSGTKATVLTLSDHVKRRGSDPHWWQDPRNAIAAVAALRDALAAADSGGAASYRARAAAYAARLQRLDAAVAACIAKVPAAQRTLVTTHDALGYYAGRYGIRVVGAVIPAQTTAAQPSAGEISKLIATIEREHVKAVFAESSVNPKVEAAIAHQSGARIGHALWADTLGPHGSDGATYVASIASNTAAMVDGFSGGAVHCRPAP